MCQPVNYSKVASKYTVCVFLLRVESTLSPHLTLLTDWPSSKVVLVWKTPHDQQLAQTPVISSNSEWNIVVALPAADGIALTISFRRTGYLEIPTYLIEVQSATTSWCQHYHWQRLLLGVETSLPPTRSQLAIHSYLHSVARLSRNQYVCLTKITET